MTSLVAIALLLAGLLISVQVASQLARPGGWDSQRVLGLVVDLLSPVALALMVFDQRLGVLGFLLVVIGHVLLFLLRSRATVSEAPSDDLE